MLKIIINVVVLLLLLLGGWVVFRSASRDKAQELPEPDEAREILKGLSLEQKIGQLFIIGFEGKTLTPETQKLMRDFRPGGVLLLSKNIDTQDQLKSLIASLQEVSLQETGLPLFIAVDQEGQPVNRVYFAKVKIAQSDISSVQQAEFLGLERGRELNGLGININLAPLLDLTQPGDFLFERSFQKKAEEIGELAKALISGQKEGGILSAVKHFPGYGGIASNPEEKLMSLKTLPDISQFQRAMEANPEFVMATNVIFQERADLPFTFSSSCLAWLRQRLDFEGLLLSDDLSQNSLLNRFSLEEIITLPLQAGVDILIFSGWRLPACLTLIEIVSQAVSKGELTEERLDNSVLKIIQLKRSLL